MDTQPDAAQQAFAKTVRLLSARDRSVREIEAQLDRAGFEESVIASAVDRAKACGLLDDHRFAESYVHSKITAGWGRARIEHELGLRGIELNDIGDGEEVLFEDDDELTRALNELKRFKTRAKNLHEARYRRLIGKGYSLGIIRQAVTLAENNDVHAI